jgi:hypothetical protein
MQRTPKRVERWADPAISPDRKSLWIRVEMEDGDSDDLEIPLQQIGDTVSFFVSVANHIVTELEDEVELPSQTASPDWAPIPVVGVGLGIGRGPEETILFVRLAGFELAFSLDGSKVAALGNDFARNAQMLSAGAGKPQ